MTWSTEWNLSAKVILPDGSEVEARDGDGFKETVLAAARDAGIRTFNVELNGEPVSPGEAPEVISAGDVVKIKVYDKAG